MLTVQYVSVIDWRLCNNILWVNPNFHNEPRFDHVLIKVCTGTDHQPGSEDSDEEAIFCQLLGLFEFNYGGTSYKTALALPLDGVPAPAR